MFVHKKIKLFLYQTNVKPTTGGRLFNNIKLIYTETSFRQKLINYLGPDSFNSLPIGII